MITWAFALSFWRPCPCNSLQAQRDIETKEAKQAAPGLLPLAGGEGARAEHLRAGLEEAAAWVVGSKSWEGSRRLPHRPQGPKYALRSDAVALRFFHWRIICCGSGSLSVPRNPCLKCTTDGSPRMKCRWGCRYGSQATSKAERKLKGEVGVWA